MNVQDKIRYFYDKVKINGSLAPRASKFPYSIAIPAAAISLLIGAAVLIPNLVKKPETKAVKGTARSKAV